MKKIFCTLCAGLLLFSGASQAVAEEVSRIAAVVIDEPITTFQLDQRFAELRAVQNERITRREALNMLIEDIPGISSASCFSAFIKPVAPMLSITVLGLT